MIDDSSLHNSRRHGYRRAASAQHRDEDGPKLVDLLRKIGARHPDVRVDEFTAATLERIVIAMAGGSRRAA